MNEVRILTASNATRAGLFPRTHLGLSTGRHNYAASCLDEDAPNFTSNVALV